MGIEGPGVTAVFHSALQGVWAQRGDHQYQATLIQLEYDQDGELLFIVSVDTRIILDPSGDRFTTRDTIEVRAPDGRVLFSEQDQPGVRGTRVRLGGAAAAGTQAVRTTLQNVAGEMVGQASFTQIGDH